MAPRDFKRSIKKKFAIFTSDSDVEAGAASKFPSSLSPVSSQVSAAGFATPKRSTSIFDADYSSPYTPSSYAGSPYTAPRALGAPSVDLSSFLGSAKSKGPKIKPFIYTQIQASPTNRAVGSSKCFICDELVHTKLHAENILSLRCGDYIHEECFKVAANVKLETLFMNSTFTANKQSLASAILPCCGGSICKSSGVSHSIEFSEPVYLETILNNAIAQSIEYDKLHLRSSRNPSVFSNSASNARGYLDTPFRLTRQSFSSSLSSLRSHSPDPTISTLFTESIKFDPTANASREKLKNRLIRNLLDSCPSFDVLLLINLGYLRLVDELNVAYEDLIWTPKVCYLFHRYLVIAEGPSYSMFSLADFTLHTSTKSILVIQLADTRIFVKSNTSTILEKWAVGFADPFFDFPLSAITSTISLHEDFDGKKNSSESTLSLLTPRLQSPTGTETVPRAKELPSTPQISAIFHSDADFEDSDEEAIKGILVGKKTINIAENRADRFYLEQSGFTDPPSIQRQSLELTLNSNWDGLLMSLAREIEK